MSSASECRQKYHLLRTVRILYGFHGCQTVTNASCRVFNLQVQITSGTVPLKLCFSASDTCLFQHLSCVQMALHSKALTFQFKIIVISFRK